MSEEKGGGNDDTFEDSAEGLTRMSSRKAGQ